MLKNNVIILMSNLPFNWSTDYVQQTMNILAKSNAVIYCDLTEQNSVKEYLFKKKAFRPIRWLRLNVVVVEYVNYIPFKRFALIRIGNQLLNVWLLKLLILWICHPKNYHKKIVWVFDPIHYPFYRHFRNSFLLLYDCVDYFSGASFVKRKNEYVRKQEHQLLKTADYVFTISKTLKHLHQRIRPDSIVVPQGFRLETFQTANEHLRSNKSKAPPIIGYVGAINYRLDYQLLLAVISKTPRLEYVFAGPMQRTEETYFINTCLPYLEKIKKLSNVTFLESVDKKQVPNLIATFSVGIIPYNSTLLFNRNAYPMKVFEYYYVGIPVVTTPIEELRSHFPYTHIATSKEDWIRTLTQLANGIWPDPFRKKQRSLALDNTWDKKIEHISNVI